MTRVASPTGPFGTAEGRALVTAVRRCQTRARMVVFVNQLFSAIAIGAAATVVWNLVWAPVEQGRWTALTLALTSAFAAAAVLTYFRTPTLSATGAAIDQRLHLQDRIVAALQVGRESDPVSALVVRDAAARLGASTPADVYPLDLGRRAAAGTLLLTIAFLTVTVDLSRAAPPRPAGTGAGSAAMARAEGAVLADSPSEAPAAATMSLVRSVDPGNTRPPGPQEADSRRQRTPEAAVERIPSPSGESETSSVDSVPTVPNAAETRSRVVGTDAQPSPRLQAQRGGEGTRPGGQSAAEAQSRALRGAGPAGAGGSAPDAGRPRGGESGGVAAGSLGSNAASAISGSSRLAERSLRAIGAARAQAQAQAAVSRDDIPPARRQYVREYFLRLQSTGNPR